MTKATHNHLGNQILGPIPRKSFWTTKNRHGIRAISVGNLPKIRRKAIVVNGVTVFIVDRRSEYQSSYNNFIKYSSGAHLWERV